MNAMAAPRPCRHAGCRALVRDGSGYCPAHQADKKAGRFADPRRGSSSERGYGAAWRKLRDHVMRRDCGLCQPCKEAGRVTAATHVDHIVPKCEGGGDDESNLQAICTDCHKVKTSNESQRAKGGVGRSLLPGCDTSGMPLASGHHWNKRGPA